MTKEIPLTQGRAALVDDEDYEYLSQWKWLYHRGYARRGVMIPASERTGAIKQKIAHMHRVIINAPAHLQVDHINGNRLDNRRSNLRLATQSQNIQNSRKHQTYGGDATSSQYKGVYWDRGAQKWKSRVTLNKKSAHLGHFSSEIDAARAYDEAARKHYGEFALLNFPEETIQ